MSSGPPDSLNPCLHWGFRARRSDDTPIRGFYNNGGAPLDLWFQNWTCGSTPRKLGRKTFPVE